MERKAIKQRLTQVKQLEQLKYSACFFVLLIVYHYLYLNRASFSSVDRITYAYYLVDYSMGFCSKLLPGAVYHLFFKEVYPGQLNVCLNILLILLFAFVALALSKIVCEQKDARGRRNVLVFILLFLTGPCTFSIFSQEFGMLDMHWLILSALFLICVSNKYLRFFIPVIYVAALLIHFSSMLIYIILFSLILLYKVIYEKGKERAINGILLAFSLCATLALLIYLLKNEQSNLVYSLKEFDALMVKRNHFVNPVYTLYYDYSLYSSGELGQYTQQAIKAEPLLNEGTTFLPAFLVELINKFHLQIKTMGTIYRELPYYFLQLVFLLVVLAPVWFFIYRYWWKKYKNAQTKPQKIFFLLIMLQSVVSVSGLFFSIDISRWLTHAFMIQFTLFFVIHHLQKDDYDIHFSLRFDYHTLAAFVYWLVYAFTFVEPYE